MTIIIFWDRQSIQGFQLPVARSISHILDMNTEVMDSPIVVRGYDRERNQHNARKILDDIQNVYTRKYGYDSPILLVISNDMYIPGDDFVFGLARPGINFGIVSTARLNNGFYGREHNDDDIIDRIAKEGAHEIGHLFGLEHCSNPECVMYFPQTLDELDRKKKMLCQDCQEKLTSIRSEKNLD